MGTFHWWRCRFDGAMGLCKGREVEEHYCGVLSPVGKGDEGIVDWSTGYQDHSRADHGCSGLEKVVLYGQRVRRTVGAASVRKICQSVSER